MPRIACQRLRSCSRATVAVCHRCTRALRRRAKTIRTTAHTLAVRLGSSSSTTSRTPSSGPGARSCLHQRQRMAPTAWLVAPQCGQADPRAAPAFTFTSAGSGEGSTPIPTNVNVTLHLKHFTASAELTFWQTGQIVEAELSVISPKSPQSSNSIRRVAARRLWRRELAQPTFLPDRCDNPTDLLMDRVCVGLVVAN